MLENFAVMFLVDTFLVETIINVSHSIDGEILRFGYWTSYSLGARQKKFRHPHLPDFVSFIRFHLRPTFFHITLMIHHQWWPFRVYLWDKTISLSKKMLFYLNLEILGKKKKARTSYSEGIPRSHLSLVGRSTITTHVPNFVFRDE